MVKVLEASFTPNAKNVQFSDMTKCETQNLPKHAHWAYIVFLAALFAQQSISFDSVPWATRSQQLVGSAFT